MWMLVTICWSVCGSNAGKNNSSRGIISAGDSARDATEVGGVVVVGVDVTVSSGRNLGGWSNKVAPAKKSPGNHCLILFRYWITMGT